MVGADTVVAAEGKDGSEVIFGKPTSAEDAVETLRRLSGRQHAVHTGVCIIADGGEKTSFYESTKVGTVLHVLYIQCILHF